MGPASSGIPLTIGFCWLLSLQCLLTCGLALCRWVSLHTSHSNSRGTRNLCGQQEDAVLLWRSIVLLPLLSISVDGMHLQNRGWVSWFDLDNSLKNVHPETRRLHLPLLRVWVLLDKYCLMLYFAILSVAYSTKQVFSDTFLSLTMVSSRSNPAELISQAL